ncbi:hypothetical protein PIB30_001547 [Stylosanthes scabra]|uniref:PB1-like domain-containing protein n=1 Tax=Stylosanthes scabra TaxID=79078 RepID=A0ABU6R3E5_9FABA|nr:hypothetical protein [Stylosanthes scabra]
MVYFNIKLYHKGYFDFVDGVMRYKGQELIIEDNDGDFWSVYEVEEQLRRLGHEDDDISAMWYKDPAVEDYSVGLRQLVKDVDALEMVRIGVERGHVELFVVHEDAPEENFPEIGYIDVHGDPPGENGEPGVEVGPNVEVGVDLNAGNGQAEEGAVEEDVPNNENMVPDVEEVAPAVGIGGDGVEADVEVGVVGEAGLGSAVQEASNEEAAQNVHVEEVDGEGPHRVEGSNAGHDASSDDSEDAEYVPSVEEADNADDIHFTDREEDLDIGDNFFGVEEDVGNNVVDKGKMVLNEDFEEEGEDSDEAEGGYEMDGRDRDDEEADEEDRIVFPVHKPQANMAEYRWEAGTVYASREEFKEAVTSNAVYTSRPTFCVRHIGGGPHVSPKKLK